MRNVYLMLPVGNGVMSVSLGGVPADARPAHALGMPGVPKTGQVVNCLNVRERENGDYYIELEWGPQMAVGIYTLDELREKMPSTWANCDPVKERDAYKTSERAGFTRGPSPMESVIKNYSEFIDATIKGEEAAASIRAAIGATCNIEAGRLEPATETTDDFTERRIAQAERVMALYKSWLDMVYPQGLTFVDPQEDGGGETFEEFLGKTANDVIKALAIPPEMLQDAVGE